MPEPTFPPSSFGTSEGPGVSSTPNAQQVYTMPDRFHGGEGAAPKGGGSKRWIVWTIVGIVVVGGVGVGSYVLFSRLSNGTTNASNANAVAVTNTSNTNRSNSNANRNVSFQTNTANDNANATNTNSSNVNAPANANGNSNAPAGNTNASTNTNAATNTNTTPQLQSPLPSSLDSDSDGLTDIEETQIYSTDPKKPDTDGDGFIDGKQVTESGTSGEVALGYNPNGAGRLSASALVKKYENTAYRYSLLAPAGWTAAESDALKKNVLISPPSSISTGEFFQVSVQDNTGQLTPKAWYLNLNPGLEASRVTEVTVNGLLGAVSLDGQTIYLGKGDTMYILTYSTGTLSQINFRTTFEMLYQSFVLTAAANTNGG